MTRFIAHRQDSHDTYEIRRDARHQHPTWVHEQCETGSEADLQHMLDQYDASSAAGKGPDACGIEVLEF